MPIYEYDCKNCEERVEILVRSGKNASPVCPNCGSALLERAFSVSHVMMGQSRPAGQTCCGREERCGTPPCSTGDTCRRES